MCWSVMQGLVVLAPKLDVISRARGSGGVEADDLIRRFTALILNGLRGTMGG